MRVLIYGFSGKILGGIETFILNMNEHMSKETVFDYIIDGDQCVYRDRIEKRGGRIFFVPGVRKNPFGYIQSFWKTLGEQRAAGTSIFYVQLFSMANMLPVFLAKLRGYKVILHAHNNGLQSKSLIYEVIHNIGKQLTKFGKFIRFTNSQLSSDFMFGKGFKSELIYNAIDTTRFSFRSEWRKEIRKEICCGNRTVVGFVGRLALQKNPLFLIEVFSEYHKLNPMSELWIIGEGELRQDMNSLIYKLNLLPFVKWVGRRNDVEKIMCGMDLLLQPSLFEGLGIVLVEGQATGLPCISSAVVIPDEARATDALTLISLEDDAEKWARVCYELPNKTDQDRKEISMRFPQHYDINIEAKRLENIISKYHEI